MKEMTSKDKALFISEENLYLRDEIKEIVIETEETDPKTIAVIGDCLKPSEGFRVRVKFKEN